MTAELGPLEVFWCWQAIALASIVSTLTGAIKKAIDVSTGEKDWHKKRRWVKALLLPAVPLVLGATLAVVLPLRASYLYDYIAQMQAKHVRIHPWAAYACWGATIGVLADYIYQRFVKLLTKE